MNGPSLSAPIHSPTTLSGTSRCVSTPPVIPRSASTMVMVIPFSQRCEGWHGRSGSERRVVWVVRATRANQPNSETGRAAVNVRLGASVNDVLPRHGTPSQTEPASTPEAIWDQHSSGGPLEKYQCAGARFQYFSRIRSKPSAIFRLRCPCLRGPRPWCRGRHSSKFGASRRVAVRRCPCHSDA